MDLRTDGPCQENLGSKYGKVMSGLFPFFSVFLRYKKMDRQGSKVNSFHCQAHLNCPNCLFLNTVTIVNKVLGRFRGLEIRV